MKLFGRKPAEKPPTAVDQAAAELLRQQARAVKLQNDLAESQLWDRRAAAAFPPQGGFPWLGFTVLALLATAAVIALHSLEEPA